MARLKKLPVRELGDAVLRLTAGEDLERILKSQYPAPGRHCAVDRLDATSASPWLK
jgi:hypothetical protein